MRRNAKVDPETEKQMRLKRVVDLQRMAQALLDDPETSAVFRRVGISGDLTSQEHEVVYVRFGLEKYYTDQNIIVALDYQAIIQALARRVASGVYSSVYDKEAQSYALSNTFIQESYERVREQRIGYQDFLVVLHEFMSWGDLPKYLKVFKDWKFDLNSEHDEDEQLSDVSAPLYAKSREIFRKYGHIGRFEVWSVASALIRDGKTARDSKAVQRYIAIFDRTTLVNRIAK